MYIRRVTTRRTASWVSHHGYRVVESRREGARVRQVAMLNLCRHFDLPEAVETHAQAIAARLLPAPRRPRARPNSSRSMCVATSLSGACGPWSTLRLADARAVVKHQEAIEAHVFGRVRDLFGLQATVTLYDLTHTYLEGAAEAIPKAKRGHSKDKRSDCPLLTLGLVLDASGFVRRSRVLAGNAVECRSLEGC